MTAKAPVKRGRPKGTGSQRIYEVIRQRILRLELLPGANIDEMAVAAEFKVSRTPVREALIRLETDGLVNILPNRGARVSPLDFTEIPELLEALELCLRVTTRWAAVRRTAPDLDAMRAHCKTWAQCARERDFVGMSEANNRFHMAIAEASHNRHLINLYRGLQPGFLRTSLALLSTAAVQERDYQKYYKRVDDEHAHLIDLIAAGDVEAADESATEHASLMRERTARYMQSRIEAVPLDNLRARPMLAKK